MKIVCVYTVERGATGAKPLPFAMDIPFGISIIATLLEKAGHDVHLLVFSRRSNYRKMLRDFIELHRPALVCLTAVSTQFAFVREISTHIKSIDPSAFVLLGGHHASLDSEQAITTPSIDAICVGEGDACAVEVARRLEAGVPLGGIPHLWIKDENGGVERNAPAPFAQDLDGLPYINRKMWEPWINEPERFPSVLLGRGCPFRCTYCSSHAMQKLADGRFVRFRSPDHIVGEIEQVCATSDSIDSVYLEVETIAHQKEAYALFSSLEEFNRNRPQPIAFGLNFTVTSVFIRNEERCREFLEQLNRANVTYLNIGLESGSERLRREVLRRPRYTNAEFIRFAEMARDYGIALDLYVLLGVPGETLTDYRETVKLVRKIQPKMVFLSIFYPYLGTDLCSVAVEQGLLREEDLDPTAERARAALDLPEFPRWRVRLEYVLFWWKSFRRHWPVRKILAQTTRSLLNGAPRLWSLHLFLKERAIYRWLHRRLTNRKAVGNIHRPAQINFTYTD